MCGGGVYLSQRTAVVAMSETPKMSLIGDGPVAVIELNNRYLFVDIANITKTSVTTYKGRVCANLYSGKTEVASVCGWLSQEQAKNDLESLFAKNRHWKNFLQLGSQLKSRLE